VGKEPKGFTSPIMSPEVYSKFSLFLLAIFALAALAFVAPFIIYRIKKLLVDLREGNFVTSLRDEIRAVKNKLHSDIHLSDVIPTKIWDRYDSKRRRLIIYNYEDYNKINELYRHLKKREYYFKKNQTSIETMRIINEECLYVADDVLRSINWKEYVSRRKKAFVWYCVFIVIVATAVELGLYFLQAYLTGHP
jgi:hypothetical protein